MKRLFVSAALLLAGCHCQDDVHSLFGEGHFVPGENITITNEEATLDFGRVPFGDSKTLSVTVRNFGAGPLGISRADGNEEPLRLLDTLPLKISTTDSHTFTVRFTPPLADESLLSLNYSGRITLTLTGTESPAILVLNVRGEGFVQDNCISLAPSPLDIGDVQLGCSATRSLGVTNVCTRDDLHLDALTLSGAGFSWESPLQEGGAQLVTVQTQFFSLRFDATDAGIATGQMRAGVTQGSLETARLLDLSARAVPRARTTDSFVVHHSMDVLIIAGNAEATLPPEYAAGVEKLMHDLTDAGVEFHLGVVRELWDWDWSCQLSPTCQPRIGPYRFGELVAPDAGAPLFFTSDSPQDINGAQQALTAALPILVPMNNATRSVPFEAARRAMTSPISDETNAGFFREGVHLAVLALSRLGEWSTTIRDDDEGWFQPLSVFFYFDEFSQRHPGLTFSAACTLPTSSCASGVDSSRLIDMANLTGGATIDICDSNWDPLIDSVRMSWVADARVFRLQHVVDPQFPMDVTVDGQTVDAGEWAFDADAGTVTLTGLPTAGSRVDVMFTTPCD
jgi:hypothetical protein